MNLDLVFIFRSRNYENKKTIADLWMGFSAKDDRDKSFKVIDTIAEGYRILVINNTLHTNKIEDILSYYEVDVEKSVPKNYYLE